MTTENEIVKQSELKYKDKLFRMIFGKEDERSKKWRLELYNALSGKNHTTPDDIELTTIENVLYITMKNDLSFLVDSQMNLVEQQSTYNPNMLIIANPLKKIVRQRNFLGFTTKKARCETMQAAPRLLTECREK